MEFALLLSMNSSNNNQQQQQQQLIHFNKRIDFDIILNSQTLSWPSDRRQTKKNKRIAYSVLRSLK